MQENQPQPPDSVLDPERFPFNIRPPLRDVLPGARQAAMPQAEPGSEPRRP